MTQHFQGRSQTRLRSQGDSISAAVPMGTEILTMDGVLPVEFLEVGDRIITRSSGALRLRGIVRQKTPADLRLVHITPDALGGKPDCETLLPPQQRILIRDWRAKALWGAEQARVAAARLIDGEFIKWSDKRPAALFSLHFARAEVIYANGLELVTAPLTMPAR